MTAHNFTMTLIFSVSALVGGCTASSVGLGSSDIITVEGMINVWGAEPFTVIVLHTEESNTYVLVLDDDERSNLITPVTARVTGRVYVDTWRGQPFAHLDVTSMDLPDK